MGATLTLNQAAFEAKIRLPTFIEETKKLNSQLPAGLVEKELVRFPYDINVQKPLQEIFKEYMNSYLSMFSGFATYPTSKTYIAANPFDVANFPTRPLHQPI